MGESRKANSAGIRVLSAGVILQFFFGIIYVWSVFVSPVSQYFGWEAASVKLTSSFMLSFFVLGILIGGKLQVKMGASKVVLAGGLMMAFGMLAASFAQASAIWLIYTAYGIIGGFGVGMAYNAIISCGQKWFPEKRGFATGVSVFAFGFSSVVFAPTVEYLIASFGLLNAFRILAVLFGAVTLILFSFVVLPEGVDAQSPAGESLLKKRQYTTMEMVKTGKFYLITLSLMFGAAAFFVLNPSFKSLAIERGVESAATALVMITGVANSLGRLSIPILSDRIGREKAGFVILAATAVCSALLCFASGILFIAAVAIIAFCYGGYSSIYPVITADHFGIKNVGSNYGMIMVGFALSALLFPMLIGSIANQSAAFIVLAGLSAIGAAFILLLLRDASRETKATSN